MASLNDILEQALEGGDGVSWISIKHSIMGVPSKGLTSFRFKRRQAKQNNYGSGLKPYNRTRGKVEYEGSVKCFADYALALDMGAPDNNKLNYAPFSYIAQVDVGGVLYTIELQYSEFMEDGFDASEGDMSIEYELPLIIGDVKIRKGI